MKSYVPLDEMKRRLEIEADDVSDDARLRSILEAVAEQIDNYCGRTYQPYSGTLYFTGTPYQDYVAVDDVLSVTSFATDTDSDRVYETTWATTDYDLEPYNAPQQRQAYSRIRMAPLGVNILTTRPRSVQLTGTFGYWLDTVQVGTLGAAISDTTTTSVTFAGGSTPLPLQTLLIGSEQLYLTALAGAVGTVERGVNGTTAATHSTGTAVYAYRYPAPVVEAAVLLAVRLFRRADAPFGVTGSPEVGQLQVIGKNDPDVVNLIGNPPYKKRGWFA